MFHPSTHLKNHAHGAGTLPDRAGRRGGHDRRPRRRRESLDAFAGLYCVNVGYGRDEIADAVHRQMQELAYYHAYAGHSSEPAIELSRRIIELAPEGMRRVYYGLSGSDANETQIKLVWYYNNVLGRPEKKKIIARERGYHGSGLMTGSLTGLPLFHKAFDLPFPQVRHTMCPHYWKYAEAGESELGVLEALRRRARAADPGRGPRDGRGLHRRAGDGHRRADPGARRLLAGDPGGAGPPRRAADRGRGGDRLRPPRHLVRRGLLRHEARPDHGRQGPDQRVPAALGRDRRRQGLAGARAGLGAVRGARPRLDLLGPPDLRRRRARQPRHHRARGPARATSATSGPTCCGALREAVGDHPLVGEVRGVGMLAAIEFVEDKAERRPVRAAGQGRARSSPPPASSAA